MLWKQGLEEESARLRDVYVGLDLYERVKKGRNDCRNRLYWQSFRCGCEG